MNQSDPRAAIVGHREQIASEPRPTRLGEVATNVEAEDLWRVYRPEWLIVYVTEVDEGAEARAAEVALDRFAGRIRADDCRVVIDETAKVLQLQVRKPNMRGEFKHLTDASSYVAEQEWDDTTIVQRNSPADHELRAYGTKRLPT